MADYYPLLSRLVASLPESTAESRRAIFNRARTALVTQLNNASPPPPEDSIAAEIAALNEAAARIETEEAQRQTASAPAKPAQPRAPIIKPPPPRSRPSVAPAAPPPQQKPPELEPASTGDGPPAAPPVTTPVPPLSQPPEGQSDPTQQDTGDWAPSHQPPPGPAGPPPITPLPPVSRAPHAQSTGHAPIQPPAPTRMAQADPQHPLASDPPQTDGLSGGQMPPVADAPKRRPYLWVLLPIFLVLAGVIGYFSYSDRLPRIAFLNGSIKAIDPGKAKSNDVVARKPGEKIGGRVAENTSEPARPEPQPSAAPNQPPAEQPSQTATPAPKIAQAPKETTQPPASDAKGQLAIAQRAALLVQTPTEENKQAVKTYVGNVIWEGKNVTRDAGQPPSYSMIAKVNIPDAKFRADMTIEKNTDTTLPASHTITWRFFREEGSPLPEIVEVGALQMRDENRPETEKLIGAQAKITSDIYIIALDATDAAAQSNVALMKQKRWFDLQLKVTGGLLAKITLEKGRPGEKILAEAFEAWSAR